MKSTKLGSKSIWINNSIKKWTIRNKRKNNIWVYGAWLGEKYADNTKYLFEYMNENKKEIRSIWISNKKEIVEKVRSKGYEAYLSTSEDGKLFMKEAGVALFTNSIIDLGNLDLSTSAYKVALWHGMPLKRIYLADNRNKNCSEFKKKLKKLKRNIYSDIERNLSICTSKTTKIHMKKTFGILDDNIVITGQPRNDILINNKKINLSDVINIEGIKDIEKSNSKIISYMPTYRSYLGNQKKLEKIIIDMVNSNDMKNLLEKMDAYLIIKGHYLVEANSIYNKRIMFVNDSQISCTQELLLVSEFLITDYSSVFIDYLIMEKPVLFLVPDYDEYEAHENGLNENYNNILSYKYAQNIDELINQIEELNTDYNKYKNESIRLNKIFNTATYDNKSYSENVYKEIIKRLI